MVSFWGGVSLLQARAGVRDAEARATCVWAVSGPGSGAARFGECWVCGMQANPVYNPAGGKKKKKGKKEGKDGKKGGKKKK